MRNIDNAVRHDRLISAVCSAVQLDRGRLPVSLQYLVCGQVDRLLAESLGPDTGGEWMKIPRTVLKSHEDAITGVGDDNGVEDSFFVSVYPNPATRDDVRLVVETVLHDPIRVRVHDTMGRLVFDAVYSVSELSYGVMLNSASLNHAGMYIVDVTQGDLRKREKVVIHR